MDLLDNVENFGTGPPIYKIGISIPSQSSAHIGKLSGQFCESIFSVWWWQELSESAKESPGGLIALEFVNGGQNWKLSSRGGHKGISLASSKQLARFCWWSPCSCKWYYVRSVFLGISKVFTRLLWFGLGFGLVGTHNSWRCLELCPNLALSHSCTYNFRHDLVSLSKIRNSFLSACFTSVGVFCSCSAVNFRKPNLVTSNLDANCGESCNGQRNDWVFGDIVSRS